MNNECTLNKDDHGYKKGDSLSKILVLTNSIPGLYHFRRELIECFRENGFDITIAAPDHDRMCFFTEMGCRCVKININRRGVNPFEDLIVLRRYRRLMREINPDVVLTYTIKPNIYGGFVCRIMKKPYIMNITGLGSAVANGGLIKKISLFLYKVSIKKANCVFFQNGQNRNLFVRKGLVQGKCELIPGSGVNLDRHCYEPYPASTDKIKILYIGRIMKDKGMDELLAAIPRIKEKHPNVVFDLIGRMEDAYTGKIDEFVSKGFIRYHGYQNDIHSFIKSGHATILPSYHEGMSNVLLETAATGRPILASQIAGCGETFDEGVSGLGFRSGDVESLINAVMKFIELPYEQKKEMGIAGRRKMEKEFDRAIVVNAYMEEITKIVEKPNGPV